MTASPGQAPGIPPAGRADARRNREIVLRTAVHAFADEGLEVSLGRIAQRARVGAGTVYRHFPSKEALLEAVLAEHIDRLAAAANQWAVRAAPGDALFGFLLEVIEKSAGRQHFCDALTADKGWPRVLLTAAAQRFREALDRLLRDAKQAGAVRGDLRADDLSALVYGGAAVCAAHRSRARGLWLARLLEPGSICAPTLRRRMLRLGKLRRRRTACLPIRLICINFLRAIFRNRPAPWQVCRSRPICKALPLPLRCRWR